MIVTNKRITLFVVHICEYFFRSLYHILLEAKSSQIRNILN